MTLKKMSKTQMVVVAAVSLCIITAGVGVAGAAADTAKTNPATGMVSAIAAKFNLNTRDVQQVFDDQIAKMATFRQQSFADRVNKAVAAGKLTQAQADLILAKEGEMKTARKALEGKTPQERQAAIKDQMVTLKKWIADNKIPQEYFPCGGMMEGHRGFRNGEWKK